MVVEQEVNRANKTTPDGRRSLFKNEFDRAGIVRDVRLRDSGVTIAFTLDNLPDWLWSQEDSLIKIVRLTFEPLFRERIFFPPTRSADVDVKKPSTNRDTTLYISAAAGGEEVEAGILVALQERSLHRAAVGLTDQDRST